MTDFPVHKQCRVDTTDSTVLLIHSEKGMSLLVKFAAGRSDRVCILLSVPVAVQFWAAQQALNTKLS